MLGSVCFLARLLCWVGLGVVEEGFKEGSEDGSELPWVLFEEHLFLGQFVGGRG